MNFNLHFGELHCDSSINDKNTLFENYIPKCYKVKRILISFNCFSEYTCITAVIAGADLAFSVVKLLSLYINILHIGLDKEKFSA